MLLETALVDLSKTLELGDRELISLVGGGGKTTSLFSLGAQLSGRVVLTTTTKMGSERTSDTPVLIQPTVPALVDHLRSESTTLVWEGVDGRMALGVSPDLCNEWFATEGIDSVVVEADGSRKRPFKAPLDYEPVVPSSTTMLIACIGASALGEIIGDCCQRPQQVAAIAGCTTNDILTPQRAAAVLTNANGSMKSLPAVARFVVAAHRVEPHQHDHVAELADAVAAVDSTINVVAVESTDTQRSNPG